MLILIVTRALFMLLFASDVDSELHQNSSILTVNAAGNGPVGTWLLQLMDLLPFAKVFSVACAGFLVLLNAVQLNSLFIRNSSFSENTYIPAAFFVFLMSCSADFYFFSPALLASSFIISSLNSLFYHIKYRGTEENIISTGFGIGLVGLIYTPFLWLYIFILLSYLIYSNMLRRRYFLMTWGFLLPLIIYWLIYFWQGRGLESLVYMGNQLTTLALIQISLETLGITLGFGLFIAIIGLGKSYSGQGKTNHQILVQRAMLWNAFFAICIAVLYGGKTLENEILIIPSLAYFCTQLILGMERKWLREGVFILCLAFSLVAVYLGY